MEISQNGFVSGFYNVELHHHLDASLRVGTIKEVAKKRNIPFDEQKFDECLEHCDNLVTFLSLFEMFLPVIQGDLEVIERIAYEAVEDQFKNHVAYFETRFAPHLLLAGDAPSGDISCLYDVIDAVIEGLTRGEKQFGVKSSLILCAIRGRTEWLLPLTKVVKHYKHHPRIRGIDMAGNENMQWTDQEMDLTKNLYKIARELGYGCTFHAGEQGVSENISRALFEIGSTRIGHGYAVFKDPELLKRCLSEQAHFEYCPISAETLSSLQTPFGSPENPIKLGLEKNVNFSLNCDGAMFFGGVDVNIKKCSDLLGFTDDDLLRIRQNAARAAFLPQKEKTLLIDHIVERK